MKIAIVGATGNAGTAILECIRHSDARVELVGIARRLPDAGAAPYRKVRWHRIDISASLAADRLAEAFAGCDAVIHLAWLLQPNHDERVMRRTNIDGTRAVLEAVERADVPHLVVASSLGAYSPGPKDDRVPEVWPARGIPGSHYGRFKGEQEAILDIFERKHPKIVVARVRPGLIFDRRAGSEIGRYFVGPWIPKRLITALPVLPLPDEFVFQTVHGQDAADAYWRIVTRRARGAFNIAAEPVVTPELLARTLEARRIRTPVVLLRALVRALWSLRLVAADPGWVELARLSPIMDTSRARGELGWSPRHSSIDAIREVVDGMVDGAGRPASPPLRPRNLLRRLFG